MHCRGNLGEHLFKCMIKLGVALVENLNFFLQLLHHVSVLVRDLTNWTVVLEGIQQCFQDIRFDHAFSKCYNFCNHWRRKGAQGPGWHRQGAASFWLKIIF